MQTAYAIVIGVLAILGYLANPKNKINQWYGIAGCFFWIGAIKQPLMFEIIPLLESSFGIIGLSEGFAPIHSVFTWILYTLATPSSLIALIYLSNGDKTHLKHMQLLKFAMYIPGLVLSFLFTPLLFGEYHNNKPSFWITYAVYNFCFVIACAVIAIIGFRIGNNTKSKKQKQRVALIFLPLLCYWLISIFVPRLINIFHPLDLNIKIFDIWQANVFLMLIAVIVFIALAFKDGFMGLKLVSQRYNWNDKMALINMSTEYTNHMFKQQVATMELCIKQLKDHYISSDGGEEIIERLNILSRSISTLKIFIDRIKRHSQIIQLSEESCRIVDLLADAVSPIKESGISIRIDIPDTLFLVCDKTHMTEVFTNIIINSSEAIHANGVIEITGAYEKSKYRLMFKDNGDGIDSDILNDVFRPHFSTKKSTEKNFGLGLYYCKNVITAHSGSIIARSIKSEGTTIIITFFSKRVAMGNKSGGIK